MKSFKSLVKYCLILIMMFAGGCMGKKDHPNLVFVFTDQMRRQAVGFMGEDPVVTPYLDRIASEGMYFTHAISNVPICSPYRAMLMTGRYPLSTGITTNLFRTHAYGLSGEEVTFGEVLQKEGYRTGYIGKWHLYNCEEVPDRKTAEEYVDRGETIPGPGRHGFGYVLQTFRGHANKDPEYWENSKDHLVPNAWSVDFETDKAIDFIRNRDPDRPFALFMSWGPPHSPYVVPEKYINIYRNRDLPLRENSESLHEQTSLYYAGISWCDFNMGRMMQAIRDEGLDENTVFIFTSDHGEMLNSHGIFNEKTYWYEESIGIPFIIRWTGTLDPGKNKMLFSVHDFMPTILGLMGIDIPDQVEGKDWSENIMNGDANGPESAFIAHYPYMGYNKPYVDGLPRHKVIDKGLARMKHGYGDLSQMGFRGVTTGKYTYVYDKCPVDEPYISFNWREWDPGMVYEHDGELRIKEFFYDNEKDPYQMHPIPVDDPDYRDVLDNLRSELKAWLRETHDPFLID